MWFSIRTKDGILHKIRANNYKEAKMKFIEFNTNIRIYKAALRSYFYVKRKKVNRFWFFDINRFWFFDTDESRVGHTIITNDYKYLYGLWKGQEVK